MFSKLTQILPPKAKELARIFPCLGVGTHGLFVPNNEIRDLPLPKLDLDSDLKNDTYTSEPLSDTFYVLPKNTVRLESVYPCIILVLSGKVNNIPIVYANHYCGGMRKRSQEELDHAIKRFKELPGEDINTPLLYRNLSVLRGGVNEAPTRIQSYQNLEEVSSVLQKYDLGNTKEVECGENFTLDLFAGEQGKCATTREHYYNSVQIAKEFLLLGAPLIPLFLLFNEVQKSGGFGGRG